MDDEGKDKKPVTIFLVKTSFKRLSNKQTDNAPSIARRYLTSSATSRFQHYHLSLTARDSKRFQYFSRWLKLLKHFIPRSASQQLAVKKQTEIDFFLPPSSFFSWIKLYGRVGLSYRPLSSHLELGLALYRILEKTPNTNLLWITSHKFKKEEDTSSADGREGCGDEIYNVAALANIAHPNTIGLKQMR